MMLTTQTLFTLWNTEQPFILSHDKITRNDNDEGDEYQLADNHQVSSRRNINVKESKLPYFVYNKNAITSLLSTFKKHDEQKSYQSDGNADFNLVTIMPDETPVNCSLLKARNMKERQRARALLERQTALGQYMVTPDEAFVTSDCSNIRERFLLTNITQEEMDFPLAFGIRLHQNVAQFHYLLRAIYRPQNIYCIHVDMKAPRNVLKGVESIVDCFPNVFLATRMNDYLYASFSAVRADVQCMRDLDKSNHSWKYFLNMAGTEFPLRTNAEMVAIIKNLNGSNDIEQEPLPEIYKNRVQYKHVERDAEVRKTTQLWPPFTYKGRQIPLKKGCAYGIFKREFIKWILASPLAASLFEWSRKIYSPDELVWATLNSLPEAPGGYPVSVSQIDRQFVSRDIMWQWTGTCAGVLVRSICVFAMEDLAYLSKSQAVVANKFNLTRDHLVLDCLDQELRYRALHTDPVHTVNWRGMDAMPHVRYAKSNK